jgi:hypothetical protein
MVTHPIRLPGGGAILYRGPNGNWVILPVGPPTPVIPSGER